jgi:ribonuclease HI
LQEISDSNLKVIGYADDFVIITRGICIGTLYDNMKSALKVVENWCIKTSLNVNAKKSQLVLFSRKRKIQGIKTLELFGDTIPRCFEVKYLGVVFDSKLTWSVHVDTRISKACMIFGHCRRLFGLKWGLKPKYVHWLYTMVILPYLTYGCSVWWQRSGVRVVQTKLNHLQRMALLGITGAMRTTPTAAIETAIGMLPLHIYIQKIARLAFYKLNISGIKLDHFSSDYIFWNGIVLSDKLLLSPQDLTIRTTVVDKLFKVEFTSRTTFEPDLLSSNDSHIAFTDGSVNEHQAGAGIFCPTVGLSLSVALGTVCSIFQSELYPIILVVKEFLDKEIHDRPLVICTDSQQVLHTLRSTNIDSALALECVDLLNKLARLISVTLVWIPGHSGIQGNIEADRLARIGSSNTFVGPEPCLGIDRKHFRERTDVWAYEKHKAHWLNLSSCVTSKLYFLHPNKDVNKYLLSLERQQLSCLIRTITGHCRFNLHMNRIGLSQEVLCPCCNSDEDTPYHLVCLCPSFAQSRYNLFGSYLLNQHDFMNLRLKDILRFVLDAERIL